MAFLTGFAVRVIDSRFLNCRHYTRWSHRRPKRVFMPDEYAKIETQYTVDDVPTNIQEKSTIGKITNLRHTKKDENFQLSQKQIKQQWIPKSIKSEKPEQTIIDLEELDEKSRIVAHKNDTPNKKKKTAYKTMKDIQLEPKDMLETVIDADGKFVYTKLPDKDAELSKLLVMVKTRNQTKKDFALVEGKRLIKEALEANCRLKNIIFSRKNDIEYLKPFLPKSGAKLYKIPYREIQMWSDLTTSPGIMGIFKIPEVEKFVPPADSMELIVICDNIREPGNLGAILRTAIGAGIQSVFLTKGCVDLWDTKVLRSACGAHFRLQIHTKMDWTDIQNRLQDLKGSILIADNKITTDDLTNESSESLEDTISKLPLLPYYGINFGELGALVLIVGGETEGISGDSYRFAAEHSGLRLNIPLSNNVDSLNTGTSLGIVLFEIKRQLKLLDHEKVLKQESC